MIKTLFILLLTLSVNAFASAPIVTYRLNADFGTREFVSLDEACTELIGKANAAHPGGSKAYCTPPHGTSSVKWFNPYSGPYQETSAELIKKCSDGSPPNIYVALSMQCPDVAPPIACKPGDEVTATYKKGPSSGGVNSGYFPLWPNEPHDGQCNLNCTDAPKSKLRSCFTRGGNDFCTWTCEKTGNVKSSTAAGDAPGAPQEATEPRTDVEPFTPKRGDCPKGTVQIGVSDVGTPQCAGTGTDPKNTPPAPPKIETEKNETLPDGSVKNTKTVTTTNTDLSKTTITTVTITRPSGEKETNQDKKTTDTPAGKPGAETPPQTDMCKQNPNLAVCKNSTVAGKCGEITCTGDAIQCATLRATAALQCKVEKDDEALKGSPLAAIGQAAIDGKDLDGLPTPKKSQVVNVGTMKAEGWLGNGAAFEDVSVSLRGQEVLIPLSKWSSYLLPFRYMLMIIASLISYRVLAGAILKE